MAKGLPYFKWYPADAEMDEDYAAMTDQELGFYHRCLNRSWKNNGLPGDLDELARVFGRTRGYIDKLWLRVGRKFVLLDGRLVNPRQEIERQSAITKSERATESVRTRYERSTNDLPRALARAESDSISVSGSLVLNSKPEPKTITRVAFTLAGRYSDLITLWTTPNEDGKVFTCADVDLGCQVWLSLIDKGTITEANVDEVLAGLERHKQSKKWHEGFVVSVPTFLGWAKNGTAAAPRWNDRPEPISNDGGY